jgi:small-conductance mechanosensitive channel
MSDWWNNLASWEQSCVAVAAAFLIHLFVRLVLIRGLNRLAASTDNDLDDRLVYFIRRFYLFILIFALTLVVLKIHGIKITAFLASAGIMGIAIGLAAKETLSDILAGIFLITDQPARIGDRVKIESPERRGESPIRHYEVIGFRGGAVYVRQDGRNYRFPVRTLKQERDLSYGIG